MSTKFAGDWVLLYLTEVGGEYKLWGCCRSLTYTESTEFVEITPTDGKQTNFLPTYESQRISAQGFYIQADETDAQWATNQLIAWGRAQTELLFRIVAGENNADIYSGTCFLQERSIEGSLKQPAGVSIEAIVTSVDAVDEQVDIACPVLTIDATIDSINIQFTADENATSYVVELLSGLDVVSTQTIEPPYDVPVNITFSDLTPSTTYSIRVTVNNTVDYFTRECNPQNQQTDAVSCPNPDINTDDTSATFSFTDAGQGLDSITVELQDTDGTPIDSVVFNTPFADPLTDTFTGLTEGTNYILYIYETVGSYTKTCGPYAVRTTGGLVYYTMRLRVGSSGGICSAIAQDYYSDSSPFDVGIQIFNDPELTSPVTGFVRVSPTAETDVAEGIVANEIFNLSSSTGIVGLSKGDICP